MRGANDLSCVLSSLRVNVQGVFYKILASVSLVLKINNYILCKNKVIFGPVRLKMFLSLCHLNQMTISP